MKSDWEGLRTKANFVSRALVLEMCVGLSMRVPGHIVEFGVASGHSTRVIRDALRRARAAWPETPHADKSIFACDSFDGLPEPFEALEAGHFACEPPEIEGVEIVEGRFAQTLTPQLADRIARISLAHFDADLYSSTARALEFVTPLVETGSLLLFDEFTAAQGAERRAFEEWRQAAQIRTELVAEFARPPSGGGRTAERRVVFQVVGISELHVASNRGAHFAGNAFEPEEPVGMDIVTAAATFRLGANWFQLEAYAGDVFRWVDNDAELVVDEPQTLVLELEAGPGLASAAFDLELRHLDQRPAQTARVNGRETIELEVDAGTYHLHVEGGGRTCPGDWRTLNFRCFRLGSR